MVGPSDAKLVCKPQDNKNENNVNNGRILFDDRGSFHYTKLGVCAILQGRQFISVSLRFEHPIRGDKQYTLLVDLFGT